MLICLFTSPSEYCIIKHCPASLMAVCLRTMSTRTACLIQFTSSLHISHELCRTRRWGNSSLLMCCFSGVKVWVQIVMTLYSFLSPSTVLSIKTHIKRPLTYLLISSKHIYIAMIFHAVAKQKYGNINSKQKNKHCMTDTEVNISLTQQSALSLWFVI